MEISNQQLTPTNWKEQFCAAIPGIILKKLAHYVWKRALVEFGHSPNADSIRKLNLHGTIPKNIAPSEWNRMMQSIFKEVQHDPSILDRAVHHENDICLSTINRRQKPRIKWAKIFRNLYPGIIFTELGHMIATEVIKQGFHPVPADKITNNYLRNNSTPEGIESAEWNQLLWEIYDLVAEDPANVDGTIRVHAQQVYNLVQMATQGTDTPMNSFFNPNTYDALRTGANQFKKGNVRYVSMSRAEYETAHTIISKYLAFPSEPIDLKKYSNEEHALAA